MIKLILRFFALVRLAFDRLWNHPGLTFLALLGIVLAVGLVGNGSFFSQAMDQVLLNQELRKFSEMTQRPPFSTSIYVFPSSRAPVSLESAEELALHVADTLAGEVGLPWRHLGIQVHSGNMMLQPLASSEKYAGKEFLESVDVIYIADVADQMTVVLGDPLDANGTSDDVLDVWMHARLAETMGINIGEEFEIGQTISSPAVSIRVRGIWKAADIESDFWFENPDATLQNALLVRRNDYIRFVEPLVPAKSWYLTWNVILDDAHVYPDEAQSYLVGFARAANIIDKFLPGAKINTPPLDPLSSFVERGNLLTILLLSFNLPAFGFLLYFLFLTSAIIATWQQRETATLVGRGLRISSILTLTIIEEFLLFIVGTPLGILFGMTLARLMGYTTSFLSFISRDPLPVSMRGFNLLLTLAALSVSLLARLIPAVRATRLTAIDVDRELARPQSKPFWQRAYLDFILALPTLYAYQQLARRGTLAMLVQDRPEDLYQDPLLVLVPAFFILTAGLLTLRVFPWVMRLLDLVANVIPWSTPHLALRQLGRQSQVYINPLLLVIVSLALGVYMLSMAASLDKWLVDRTYYNVGADMAFTPKPASLDKGGLAGPEDAASTDVSDLTGEWIPFPAEFEDLPGVAHAARVGDYTMSAKLIETGEARGRFLAIDRADFGDVAWFRSDFARDPLMGVLNRLAVSDDGILVSEKVFEENHLQVGDTIEVRIGINYALNVYSFFTVAGTYKYFPTVYENEDEAVFIGNLEYLTFYFGIIPPHDIWLRLDKGVTGEDVLDDIRGMGLIVNNPGDAGALIAEEQAKQERVGVFGTLSVGFMAAVAMAVLGLLVYTYASLRDRLKRFTILRAIGLLRRQIMGQVVMEYAVLTAFGGTAGALVGKWASDLFIPFFRITGGANQVVPLPPLIPIIARSQVTQLVAAFVLFIVVLEVLVIAQALSRRAFSMLKNLWG
ncbi:MAG: ABC transporter permease [Anaerolineae bacterium]|nr:ABC transporter permease [Anaerolineae bacterium]